MGKMCCVSGCKSKSFRDCGISFFQFPRNQDLNRKWLEVVNGRIGISSVVCSLHFKQEEIVSNQLNSKKYLVSNAVPSIFHLTRSPHAGSFQPSNTVSNNVKAIDNVTLRSTNYHNNDHDSDRDFDDDSELDENYGSNKQENKMVVNIIRCKCCLRSGKLKNMWLEHNDGDGQGEYGSMLIECFALPWRKPDNLKKNMEHICQSCIQRLKNALSFRVEVLASQTLLKSQLETTMDEDVDKLQDELEEEEDPHFNVTTEYLDYEYLEDSCDSDNDGDAFDKLKENVDITDDKHLSPTCIEELDEVNLNLSTLIMKKGSKRKQKSTEIKNTVSDREDSPAIKRIKVEKNRKVSPAMKKIKEGNKNISNNTRGDVTQKNSNIITHNKIIGYLEDVIRYSNATPIGGHSDDGFECCYCKDQYDNPQNLKLHTLDKHADKVLVNTEEDHVKLDITDLKCLDCDSRLSSVEELVTHLQRQHHMKLRKSVHYPIVPFKFDSEELRCAICNKVFERFDALSNHMGCHIVQDRLVQREFKVDGNTFYYAFFNSSKNSEALKEKHREESQRGNLGGIE